MAISPLEVTGKMMMIDTSKCIGCKACQVACQQWHSLPAEETEFTGSYENPPDMSAANLTIVRFFDDFVLCPAVSNPGFMFFKDQCRHCDTPYCKKACPLTPKGIKRKKNGIVYVTANCDPTACSPDPVKPCQLACPFKTSFPTPLGLPRYLKLDGSELDGRANKCDFCYDRFGDEDLKGVNDPPAYGGEEARFKGYFNKSNKPACELACTTGAIKSGKAEKIWTKAHRRAKKLKNKLGFPNACVYPSIPTHVIWVLKEDPECYGLPDYALP